MHNLLGLVSFHNQDSGSRILDNDCAVTNQSGPFQSSLGHHDIVP